METVIKLPDVEAVQNFVKVATETDCDVLVSKEGYKYIIDGTSILGSRDLYRFLRQFRKINLL